MTTDTITTVAIVPSNLREAWLQHMRNFDTANPGCHFVVRAHAPSATLDEIVKGLESIEPPLPVRVAMNLGAFRQPPTAFRITDFYVWVAIDPGNGNEGAVTGMSPVGPIPLIACDKTRIEETREYAQNFVNATGVPITLAHFTNRKNIEQLEPRL